MGVTMKDVCQIDSWGEEFIAYLVETIDFSDPNDKPLGQPILRQFDLVYPRGRPF
jgi:hypothetical protein